MSEEIPEEKYPHRSRRQVLRAAGLAIGAAATSQLRVSGARAAGYPDRPIKIVVPFAPAGPTDIMARILAQHLATSLGGNIITENRSGAGGNIGIGYVAHAEPDGYTLLVTSSAYVVNPGLYAKVPYDPTTDFAPIAELGTSPNVILADPRLGITTIGELIARAKAHPDELNYASPGAGTTPHLSGEFLKIAAGIDITHVPFSGAMPAIQALLGGVTQLAVAALPPAHPYIESGALKALAVTGAHRWFDLKDVPTMVELGYQNFIAETFQALLAPAKTPPEIVARLAAQSIEVLQRPEIREQLLNNGFEVIANGPDGLRRRIAIEVPKWRDIIARAGIKPV
ncbi:Bug family tripartite tricarboxylate transporter substrate binding protein [Bradyrhizobium sp.]|jgi:tripartite-type tricarboxylate transporter receptor subunit TctC|uniref:Bug family tripartite tricarboxylate transporter substrate binding protein n=1 Tax=Bradyrhizobium sp. TaxID=376 RepID=UPI003D0E36D6